METKAMRGAILNKAQTVINGDRQNMYGNPEDSFSVIGDMWTAYLHGSPKHRADELKIDGHDVAVMMALMKLARITTGAQKEDSYVDAAGYLALAYDIAGQQDAQKVVSLASKG